MASSFAPWWFSRKFVRRPRKPQVPHRRMPLLVERLEDRTVPTLLVYTAPAGVANAIRLFKQGNNLRVEDNGVLVRQESLSGTTTGVQINSLDLTDSLTVDYNAGGTFALADGIAFDGGTGTDSLIIKGTSAGNVFTISSTSVALTGASTTTATATEALTVNGLGGDDTFTVNSTSVATALTGDSDSDALIVNGTANADAFTINGSTLTGTGATLTYSTMETVTVNGAGGADAFTVNAPLTTPLTINGDAPATTPGDTLLVNGTAGPDTITITATTVTGAGATITYATIESVTVNGLGGNDTLLGGPGNDVLLGGNGADCLVGGNGNDTLDAGAGDQANDVLLGGPDNDTLISTILVQGGVTLGTGDDALNGGTGNDTYIVLPGSTITVTDDGGTGDTLDFGGTSTQGAPSPVSGTLGSSPGQFTMGTGTVNIPNGNVENAYGTPFNDSLQGNTSNNVLLGRGGDDTLISVKNGPTGTTGDDLLNGGLGNDKYIVNPGSTITVTDDGGTGDTLDFGQATQSVSGTLGSSPGLFTVGGGTVSIPNADVENLSASPQDDFLTGTPGPNLLNGGGGNDTIDGGGGDDTINGGPGNDSMVGGSGNDTFIETPGSTDFINDTSGTADTIDFYQITSGGITIDLSKTGQAQTYIAGNQLTINGTIENVIGTKNSDSITGNSADNLLLGKEGNDSLVGSAGNDILVGGDGNDHLTGGPGLDILIGGRGADRLVAGSDVDILIAGYTKFNGIEDDPAALNAIRKEWIRTDISLTDRVNHLRGIGSGANGTTYLLASGPNQTVVNDDGAVDTLTGSNGPDWLFFQQSGLYIDVVTDLDTNQDIVNDGPVPPF